MICSFGAILAWKSDHDDTDADDAEYTDDCKSDPHMSPSYASDTKSMTVEIQCVSELCT